MTFLQLVFVMFLIPSTLNIAIADVERVIQYEYDGAGNIVRILSQEQSAPPVITNLAPNFVNIGRTVSFTATGSGLLGVDITTNVTGVSVSNIESSLENQTVFQVNTNALASTGNATFDFTTGLGTTTAAIFIAEPRPDLTSSPNPIAISPSGTPTNVSLLFTKPRSESETYNVSLGNTNVVTTITSSFTILAGQRQASITLTGLVAGVSSLEIEQPEKFFSYSFPVYVGKSYLELLVDFPDMAQRNLFSSSVGVFVKPHDQLSPTALVSKPVGILLDIRGGFVSDFVGVLVDSRSAQFSKPIGVFIGDGVKGSLLSLPIGVTVSDIENFVFSPPVQSIYGPLLDAVLPITAAVNTTTKFEASGFNLNEVLSVSISPATDAVIGAFTVNAQGTQITIPVNIDSVAALGSRELNLIDANGAVLTRSGLPLTFVIQ